MEAPTQGVQVNIPRAAEARRRVWSGADTRGLGLFLNPNRRPGGLEPKVRIELTAYALPRRCSTTELLGHAGRWYQGAVSGSGPRE
jgi:hypothetical protein